MKPLSRWVLPLLLCSALAWAAGPVSVSFRGSLGDALKTIAQKGDLNLVVQGNLSEPVEVYLKDVPPEEALRTTAEAHGLKVSQSGRIFTVRPWSEAEKSQAIAAPRTEEAGEQELEAPAMPSPPGEGRHHHKKGNDRFTTGPLRLGEEEAISGDAVSLGGPMEILGAVGGDVVAIGGKVHLGPTATVGGDVTAIGGEVTKDPGAQIGGQLVTVGGKGLGSALGGLYALQHPGAGGPDEVGEEAGEEGAAVSPLVWVAARLLQFAVLFGVGFLCLLFAPQRMKVVQRDIREEPLWAFLTGIAGVVTMSLLALLLVVSLIGIPFGFGLITLMAVAFAMGLTAVAYELGDRIPLGSRKSQALVLALGVLLVVAASSIPRVGTPLLCALTLLGFGAIVRTRFGGKIGGPAATPPPPPATAEMVKP